MGVVGVVGGGVERLLVHDLSPLPLSLAINHCIKILALFGELMAGWCAYLGKGKLNITSCMRFSRFCILSRKIDRFPFNGSSQVVWFNLRAFLFYFYFM